MNKILRISMIAVLALIANVSFGQEVTLDFSTNNWKLPEGSTNKIKTAATYTDGTYTISMSASSDGHYWNPDGYLLFGKANAFITLPAFDFDVAKIVVEGRSGASSSTVQNIFVGDQAVSTATTGANKTNSYAIDTKHQAKGNIYSIKVTSRHNTQIVSIKIYKVGSEIPEEPEITYTDVPSVKDLLANYTKATSNLNLKLTNAKVLYVNNYNGTVNTYVREGDAAIELRTLGFNMPVNSTITGTVKVDLALSYGVPYLAKNAGTTDKDLTIQESTEAAKPIVATVADIVANKYMNDLILIKNFKFSKEEYQTGKYNYYANDGDSKIMIYDKFSTPEDNKAKIGGVANLTEGETYSVKGIFGAIFKNVQEVIPIEAISTTTGINNITTDATLENAPAFNLAGQKEGKAYKGVVIKAGKKFVQK